MKKLSAFILILLWALIPRGIQAAPLTQEAGQAYVVQAGDWLSKIAAKYYGDPLAYPAIVEATNAKAKEDSSFTVIANPDALETGQKLWIPAVAEPGQPSAQIADPQQAYLNAVKDAEIAEPAEISTGLISILESNQNLVWQGESGQKQVLLLTWTSWNGYDDKVGQAITTTRETWVTAVPELKDFCTAYNASADNLTLRLEQLLGLPPHNGKTRFVEIWAAPQDLFRPSPDPEITDHEAQLDFPASKYLTVSQEHVAWINNLKSQSYGENGYPWTRLGYTYDWGNPQSEVGLSEFVINPGATVTINAVTATADYCQ